MLIEFSVANYKSFRDLQRFTMLAAPKRANDGGLEESNVFESNGLRALKTKGIYGLNASGKSNILSAFSAFSAMALRSVADEEICKKIWTHRFLLQSDWDEQPMFFQLIFTQKDKVYRYGFQIKKGIVASEWLSLMGDKEVAIFNRSQEEGIKMDESFKGAGDFIHLAASGNHEIFRKDALFLTGAALMGNQQAIEVRDGIRNIILLNGIYDKRAHDGLIGHLQRGNEHDKEILTELMKAAETGAQDLIIEINDDFNEQENNPKESSKYRIISTKARFDDEGRKIDHVNGYFKELESAGTQKWLYTSFAMLVALSNGSTLLIDEFDAKFHPNLTLKIVQLFNQPNTNPKNAQLIFATHDTGLLRRANLRRDQICLVDKNKFGVSSIKNLIQFKGVRKDASYEKEYLEGSYGAVAYLDDIDNIIADFLTTEDATESE